MMMGFGSSGGGEGGGGGGASSSSNLSALAPPFTVERHNLRPSTSNPLVQFSDSQSYAAAPFAHATRQCSNPSAPTPRPDMYQRSQLDIDSTSTTSVPLGNDYLFGYSVPHSSNDPQHPIHWSTGKPCAKTSSPAFLYDDKVEPYYPPYVSPVLNHDSPLIALSEPCYDMLSSSGLVSSSNVPSQVDYTQSLSGLEYPPQWHAGWSGLIDAKRGKRAQLDGDFSLNNTNPGYSHAYGSQMNQGYYAVKCGDILEKDSGISYEQFPDVSERESSDSLLRMEMDNMSTLAHKVYSLPFDSSRTTISSPSFTIPVSYPPGSSLHSPKNFMNLQKSQNPYEKCIVAHDSSITGSLSVTKSSPALVIRPPPSALVSQKAASSKNFDTGNVASIHLNGGMVSDNPSKAKEHQILLNSEVEGSSLFSSQFRYQREDNGQLFSVPSAVMKELPSDPQTTDGLNNIFKANAGLQVPNLNVSDGSSLSGDCFQAIKSSDNVPDTLDHHNIAVDSPCWKGAPASQFSPFDVVETERTHPFVKRIDKFCQVDVQVDENFSLPKDPIRCFYQKPGEDKVHECNGAGGGISLIRGNTSETDCTTRELKSVDAVKAGFKDPILTTSQGPQFCENYNMPKEDCDLLTPTKNDSEPKSSGIKQLGVGEDNLTPSELNFQTSGMDSILNTSDTAEGAVAVHAAEHVLCSPSSEEAAPEQAKQYECESAPKLDVQAMVKALQSLSELLMFNCLTDSSALKDEDFEVLKCAIRNLDALASKKMEYLTEPQERFRQQVTCHKVGNSVDPHMNNAAGRRQFGNDMDIKSRCHLDYQDTHDEMKNHTVSQEKTKKCQLFSPLTDDLDVLKDDNMAQAIRKVLEENFHPGEEMESQALLFKNLWLEAEAKLCSISYRARFDRMKMEMQKFKSNQRNESAAASESTSTSSTSHDLETSDLPPPKVENGSMQKASIWSLPKFSPTGNADGVEASVMTRFHILKCRDDSKGLNLAGEKADMVNDVNSGERTFLEDQLMDGRIGVAAEAHAHNKHDVNQGFGGLHTGGSQIEPVKDGLSSTSKNDDVEASIMTRLNILKCRDESKGTNLVGQQAGFLDAAYSDITPFHKDQPECGGLNLAVEPHSHGSGDVNHGFVGLHVGGSGNKSVNDFFLSVPDDPVTQSSMTCGQRNQYSVGSNDNCSSDWEHVVKDDVSWH